ncbi:RluA family pseudouridine synthase [Fimbriiglobus ruber]|uniref:Pseudouridine synthase n=1 Tax=Fimbriiglobus ruber TaxID=1908690 RepID=A0A225E9X2_9BACT|nr:RluA family pseudouridine synthase [Fimbriiglobus ruber]OWK46826.1 Ribosomal large subunit pseudouridine synthase D [Fimbriiglobus ruber]
MVTEPFTEDEDLLPSDVDGLSLRGPTPDAADGVPHPAYARSRDPVELLVRIKAEGMRLDHYLQIYFHDFSRSELQKAITGGHVLVNGKPSKPSHKVRDEDKLYVTLPEPIHDVIVPEDIPLDVLYEDECVAIINKPADMVVHPARGNWTGTLANALAFRFKDQLSRANGTFRPGIVHRLDRDTSGVILIAKDEITHREVAMQFETRKVHKEYVALTAGELDRDSDYIEARLKHHPHIREQMVATLDQSDPGAKDACSYYEVLERFRGHTLVKVQPRTGRTHQIRVHLAFVNCPVIADKLYGSRDRLLLSDVVSGVARADDELLIARQALHAFRLRFRHPKKGAWVEVEAPLPADIRKALEALRQHRPHR